MGEILKCTFDNTTIRQSDEFLVVVHLYSIQRQSIINS